MGDVCVGDLEWGSFAQLSAAVLHGRADEVVRHYHRAIASSRRPTASPNIAVRAMGFFCKSA